MINTHLFKNNEHNWFVQEIKIGYLKEGDVFHKDDIQNTINQLQTLKTLGLKGVYATQNDYIDYSQRFHWYNIDAVIRLFEGMKNFYYSPVAIEINHNTGGISFSPYKEVAISEVTEQEKLNDEPDITEY